MIVNKKIMSANEHVLLLRQQQLFNDKKQGLVRGGGDRVHIDFVRFKAQRYHIEGLVDKGDGDTIMI